VDLTSPAGQALRPGLSEGECLRGRRTGSRVRSKLSLRLVTRVQKGAGAKNAVGSQRGSRRTRAVRHPAGAVMPAAGRIDGAAGSNRRPPAIVREQKAARRAASQGQQRPTAPGLPWAVAPGKLGRIPPAVGREWWPPCFSGKPPRRCRPGARSRSPRGDQHTEHCQV